MRLLVLALAVLAAGVSASSGATTSTACAPTFAARLDTGSAAQLITVVAASRTSTQGLLKLWTKRAGCWRPSAGPWTAWLGSDGTSPAKREGDRRTPTGIFGFLPTMYGISPSPGVRYRYHRVACGDWWVEDPASPYYNRFRHVRCGSRPPFRTTSEDMSRSPIAYQHLAVIAYNTGPVVPGRGSGIFFHVSTGRPTLGCVSLPYPQLVAALRWLRPAAAPLIAIGTAADLLRASSQARRRGRGSAGPRFEGTAAFPQRWIRARPDATRPRRPHTPRMKTSYGVVWRTGDQPLARGKLELLPRAVRLDGLAGEERVVLEIPYEDLDGVHAGRTQAERLNGHPTLVLEPHGGEPVVLSAVAQAGVLAEITEHVAKQKLG